MSGEASIAPASAPKTPGTLAFSLLAIGIVFGDIGAGPIYAIRDAFHASHGVAPTPENVLGFLSLMVWSLILVISVKYINADRASPQPQAQSHSSSTLRLLDGRDKRRPLRRPGTQGRARMR